VSVDLSVDFKALNKRLEKLDNANIAELSALLAAEGESQTRRRLSEEKASPDGTPWDQDPWSEAYAKTRHSGHSLLENEGHLIDSIISESNAGESMWGSNLAYAAAQNFGFEKNNLPAHEFLGLSDENKRDMVAIIDGWLDDKMGVA